MRSTSTETSTEPQQTSSLSKKCSRSREWTLRSTSRETSTEPQQTSNLSKKCTSATASASANASASASAVDNAPSRASISASEPVQVPVPVPVLLSLLVPVVHMPSSVPVHVQSNMSQLEDVTCLRVQHIQPVNMVKHVLKV